MSEPLTGVAALIQDRIDRLVQLDAWLPTYVGSDVDDLRAQHENELSQLRNELEDELKSRRIVLLGVVHRLQDVGHSQNEEFGRRLAFLADRYGASTVLEEWANDRSPSFASAFATGRFDYRDVGTSGQSQFETFTNAPITHPGHNGTLGPCEDAPPMLEYGPLTVQEHREQQMTRNIEDAMLNHRVGIFIVGLAHLHSMAMKLQMAQHRVAAYSWLG